MNMRSAVAVRDWYRIRQMVCRRADRRCEACGRQPDQTVSLLMEAHERFTYDHVAGVQKVRRLICLCSACHATTHFGLANLRGKAKAALGHLQLVTGMTRGQAEVHVAQAFEMWELRSRITWAVDLSVISDAGIAVRQASRPAVPASSMPTSATPRRQTKRGRRGWLPRLRPGQSRITAIY